MRQEWGWGSRNVHGNKGGPQREGGNRWHGNAKTELQKKLGLVGGVPELRHSALGDRFVKKEQRYDENKHENGSLSLSLSTLST